MQDKLFARFQAGQIEPIWHHQADEVFGDDTGVTGLRVRSLQDNSTREIVIHGLFVAIGHTPNTSMFEGQLETRNGYLVIKSGLGGEATQTSVPGVFAAGDVADQVYLLLRLTLVAWPRWMPRSSSSRRLRHSASRARRNPNFCSPTQTRACVACPL